MKNNLFPPIIAVILLICLPLTMLIAQDNGLQLTGTVISTEDGQPLPGVNIVEKGTMNGVITDPSGRYKINVQTGATLLFSFIGYTTVEKAVGAQTVIDVQLTPDIQTLDEIVVIGYGTTTKKDLTGAVGSVKAEEIKNMPVPGIDRAIQGRVAGVYVSTNGGSPGASASVRIRGMGSINASNDPLYVIDGIPVSGGVQHLLNPNDIENIDVLKDASAAAIYGSRGANGVVLITTRKGKSGAPRLTFETYAGSHQPLSAPPLADAEEFVRIHQTAHQNGGTNANPDLAALDPATVGKGTDWWKELTRVGSVQNYNLSLSGGTDDFKYLSSASYFKEDGFVRTTTYDRLSFRLNTEYRVSKIISLGTNLGVTNNTRRGINENTHDRPNAIANVFLIDPLTPVYKTPQQIVDEGGDPSNPYDRYHYSLYTNRRNVRAQLDTRIDAEEELRLLGDVFLEVRPFSGFNFRSTYGINLRRREGSTFTPRYFIDALDFQQESVVESSMGRNDNWVWNNIATYKKKIGEHDFTVMGGMTAEYFSEKGLRATGRATPTNDPELRYIESATIISGASGGFDFNSLLSYLGRVNYNYKNKYLLTASVRYDGSSKFAEGNKWGTFPSFSTGYVISEEPFMKAVAGNWLSFMKIRAGWGRLGNQNINTDAIYTLLEGGLFDRYPFGTTNTLAQGFRPGNIGNPAIIWETIEQVNIGADFELLENISFSADYFQRNTENMLVRVPVPMYFGYAAPWSNPGSISNEGLEFTANYKRSINKFSFNVGGNISFVRNKVTSIGDGEPISGGNTTAGNATRTEIGHPISAFYGYVTDGIFQNTAEVEAYVNADGQKLQVNAKPGDFRFKDLTGDGVLNDDDRTYIGSPHPDFFYGFNLDVSYGNFSLTTFWQGQYGNEIFMNEKFYSWSGDGTFNSVKGLYDRAWKGEGTSNTQPILTTNQANNNFRVSDYYLSDGSYLRLKNIQLNYNIPVVVLKKLGVSRALIYVAGNNLLTFTNYDGLDPELGTYDNQGNANLNLGINRYAYPVAKTYMAGLQVTF